MPGDSKSDVELDDYECFRPPQPRLNRLLNRKFAEFEGVVFEGEEVEVPERGPRAGRVPECGPRAGRVPECGPRAGRDTPWVGNASDEITSICQKMQAICGSATLAASIQAISDSHLKRLAESNTPQGAECGNVDTEPIIDYLHDLDELVYGEEGKESEPESVLTLKAVTAAMPAADHADYAAKLQALKTCALKYWTRECRNTDLDNAEGYVALLRMRAPDGSQLLTWRQKLAVVDETEKVRDFESAMWNQGRRGVLHWCVLESLDEAEADDFEIFFPHISENVNWHKFQNLRLRALAHDKFEALAAAHALEAKNASALDELDGMGDLDSPGADDVVYAAKQPDADD